MTQPDAVIAAGNILGEGIQWHGDALWWTDIQARRVYRSDWSDLAPRAYPACERIGSFALTAEPGRLLCAFETGFGLWNLEADQVAWLARVESPGSGIRFNDGRVDRRGQFWAGTMVEDANRAGDRRGALYRCEPSGTAMRVVGDVSIANGLCWSPDGDWMYFADSPERTIWRFAVDRETGLPGEREVFARTPEGAYPDGACIDASGCYWSAQWGASRVVRYTPEGSIDQVIETPVSQPSCVAFGGPDLRQLCITTARDGLDDAGIAAEPLAGDILIYRVETTGLAEDRWRGS